MSFPSGGNTTAVSFWTGHFDPLELGIYALLAAGVYLFVKRRGQRFTESRHHLLPVREFIKGHNFVLIDLFAHASFCNICEDIVEEGFRCEACDIVTHRKCAHLAHGSLRCKAMSSFGPDMKHHLVKGNLPPSSICGICHDECEIEDHLTDFRCIWCKITVHTRCVDFLNDICDLGPYRDFIIPPNCIKLKLVGLRPRRQTVVSAVRAPENAHWMPLIVIGNRKSGAGDSSSILGAFRNVLNPGQVIDVNVVKPEEVLEWINLLPNHVCRILICGGDGTVGWILTTIDKLKLKPRPAVGIIPIGTGNDLSNVLGWGSAVSLPLNMEKVFRNITQAEFAMVDRWTVCVRPTRIGLPLPAKTLTFNNYVSLGVDALVTLNFHRKREQIPRFFASRYMNKFLYFTYGTMDVLERACLNLNDKVSLECDGKQLTLPVIEGLVFLNIPSWGAGVDVWNLNAAGDPLYAEQVIDDGYLEVFALYSSFHIAQMQVGLSSPHRLCRAKNIKLTLRRGKVPMQVDGEPWEQGPGVISISYFNQALLLELPRK
ncbi:diacylglycerol kinase epsilon-like [Paramacrobiotus metropolitanus]|uniref:diacylglycerol kinase epsilon-like n=1 Tax=Paramacrobiotus metropolitanus TaxID=2943436 RepID=UPI00244646C6|nr:diacylglycerol kinase epsilon-like [Paramacrobiotus metropolitanus]